MNGYVEKDNYTITEVRRENESTRIKISYKGFSWDVDHTIFTDYKKRDIIEYLRRYFEKQMDGMVTDVMRLMKNHSRYVSITRNRPSYRGYSIEYDDDGNFIGYSSKHKKRKRRRNGSR